jgi:hypothetical protein
MRSIGIAKVKSLDHSHMGCVLTKPLDQYTFKVLEHYDYGTLAVICDGEEGVGIVDIDPEDLESFARHSIVPNTMLTDIMQMFRDIERGLPDE